MRTVDGGKLDGPGVCYLNIQVKDDQGASQTMRQRFAVVDTPGHVLILGLPWLEATDPVINWRARKWRYPVTREILSLGVSPKQLQTARVAVVTNIAPSEGEGPEKGEEEAPEPRLPALYREFDDVATINAAAQLPEHSELEHRIELEDGAQAPWGPIYPLAPNELEVLRNYLVEAEAKGWIQPSTSPAGAPILFVPKKGGKLRLCVDYRALNRVTRKDRTPLPLIGEILDRLSTAKIYTKLDLKDAYHRIRIRAGDEWKTAFRTRYGHFEYKVMPFGLVNAPATFQAYINRALVGLVDVFCIVYLDDILIYSDNEAEHEQHVRRVLERLRQWKLYINLAKCEFHTQSVTFLGFVVSPEGIHMERARVEAIEQWPLPRTVRDIQAFLGFAGFYRRFIHRYSKITSPLTDLLKGNAKGPIELPIAAKAAFKHLKAVFTQAPVLQHYDASLPTRVETDASIFAIGAVLTQLREGRWHPVAFRSRKLTPIEVRYGTGDGELLAIVDAVRAWRHYLLYLQQPLVVLTDHLNLQYWTTKKRLSARQLRWLDDLSALDMVIQYRPGSQNPADGLSRRTDWKDGGDDSREERRILDHVHIEQVPGQGACAGAAHRPLRSGVVALVKRDGVERLGPRGSVVQYCLRREHGVRKGDAPESNEAVGCKQRLRRDNPEWVIECTCRLCLAVRVAAETGLEDHIRGLQQSEPFVSEEKWKTRRSRRAGAGEAAWAIDEAGLLRFRGRVFVPHDVLTRQELLRSYHDEPTAGHLGVHKTLNLLARYYYWDAMIKDVKDYVRTCPVCQRTKAHKHRPYGLLAPLPPPSRPWQEITMDFITGLPPSTTPDSQKHCNAILVVVDRFTKYSLYLATTTQLTSSGLADLLFHRVVTTFGLPDGIVTDRGSIFTSNFWTDLCFHFATKRRLSTAFHPQTDGQTERQNQSVEHYLRAFCDLSQADWAPRLSLAQLTYNNS